MFSDENKLLWSDDVYMIQSMWNHAIISIWDPGRRRRPENTVLWPTNQRIFIRKVRLRRTKKHEGFLWFIKVEGTQSAPQAREKKREWLVFSNGRTNSERAAGARKMDLFSMFSEGRIESAAGARKIWFLVPLAMAKITGISSEIQATSENPPI